MLDIAGFSVARVVAAQKTPVGARFCGELNFSSTDATVNYTFPHEPVDTDIGRAWRVALAPTALQHNAGLTKVCSS